MIALTMPKSASDYLCDLYMDEDVYVDIAQHGCSGGTAHSHIYYTDTAKFFHTYEESIYNEYEDLYGHSILFDAVNTGNCESMMEVMNWCTWWYIENWAQNAVSNMEDKEAG